MSARRYAEGTSVPVASTRVAIEAYLIGGGATSVVTGTDVGRGGFVGFTLEGRSYRIVVPFRQRKGIKPEQLERETWRTVLLLVKGKMEVVRSGIVSVEQEFLAHLLLPNGQTVGEAAAPHIAEAYEQGAMPASRLLPP